MKSHILIIFIFILIIFNNDGAFSIDTGLELAGVARPVRLAESIYNLHRKGGPIEGVLAASPMPKSISFSRNGKRLTVDGFVIAYLFSVELLDIYHG